MSTNEKPLTLCPLPTGEELKQLRIMTNENDHSGARVAACQFLVGAFDEINPDKRCGNPFRPLLAGLAEVAAEHERVGHISEALADARFALWCAAMDIGNKFGLADAVLALRRAL